jgi:membrane protein
MFSAAWKMLKDTVLAFINDEALSRGAAIAFYTVTSIGPVLLIVIAIAGLAFGQDAAQNALTAQLSGLMGQQTAEVLQTAVAGAASKSSGIVATMIGIITLIVTASGVFVEMQTALNAIWKATPKGTTVSQLIRARAASLGLVAALGFLLMVSLVVSTALTAFGNYLDSKSYPTGISNGATWWSALLLPRCCSLSENRSLVGTLEAVQLLRASEPRAR